MAAIFLTAASWKQVLQPFLVKWEGFLQFPKWDFKQWSWGYGSRVPGSVDDPAINPGGQITRAAAMIEALKHVVKDYEYLKQLVKVHLKPKQWAALLSFSYNLGPGNADNLVSAINMGDNETLRQKWNSYIMAGGTVKQYLIDRRAAEWELYSS